jgi:hypothetical protein
LYASTPERRTLYASHGCVIVSVLGKAEQEDFLEGSLFSGGGASEPHRLKYSVVGTSFQQLPRS